MTPIVGVPLVYWLIGVFLIGCGLSAGVIYVIQSQRPSRLIVKMDRRGDAEALPAAETGSTNRPRVSSSSSSSSGNQGTAGSATDLTGRAVAPGGASEFAAASIAKNVNDAMRAIVKIEVAIGSDRQSGKGTGFFINDKAWIATCWHVVEDAGPGTQAKLVDGSVLPLAGVIAKAPDYDLAIVKPAQWPARLTYLDISMDHDPPLGGEVFVIGHPINEDFVVRKGTISSLLTTNQFLDEAVENHIVGSKVKYARSMQWVRHDTAILPGNSGGPLFLADGRVVGVNTFVNRLTGSGYASHVRHLRELAAKARDQVEPFGMAAAPRVFDQEPPFSPGEIEVSARRIEELVQSVLSDRDGPATDEQYAPWAELARQMTFAGYTRLSSVPDSEEVAAARVKAADAAFDRLLRATYGPKQVAALGVRAGESLSRPKSGVVFFGIVLAELPGVTVMKIEGADQVVVVPNDGSGNEESRGTRRLIVGVVSPRGLTVQGPKGPERLPMIFSHYSGELK